MKPISKLVLCGASFLVATTAHAAVEQQRAFGAMTGTVCTGPLSASTADGVQIFGFTNATRKLTWQVFSLSDTDETALVFETSARWVDETVPLVEDGLQYYVCVVRTGSTAQDFDLSINSQTIE